MRQELEAASLPVAVVGINDVTAVPNQASLTARAAFPLFQDVPDVGAWDLEGGHKDDFFVYDRAGKLAAYLPNGGTLSTDLSTAEGYQNVKNAVLQALAR